MESTIYAMCDSAGAVRYIGKVSRLSLEERLYRHLQDARRRHHNRRCIWIRSLLARGVSPTIVALEVVAGDGCEAERVVIKRYRDAGADLVNGTAGGEGSLGRVVSEKTRRAVAEANRRRVWDAAARERHSKLFKGRPIPTAQRLKISESRKTSVAAHAHSLAQKGRIFSKEHREKISLGVTRWWLT